MPTLESLKRSILTECEDDHVGLWSVIRDVEDFFPNLDELAIRDRVLTLLDELLHAHEIKAGFPSPDGRRFLALGLKPEKVVAKIKEEWPLDRRPTIGEGVWFTRAKKQTQQKKANQQKRAK